MRKLVAAVLTTILFLNLGLIGCGSDESSVNTVTRDPDISDDTRTTTPVSKQPQFGPTQILTDTAFLGTLINLKLFPPDSAKYVYLHHDNSGGDSRSTVPGPSDSQIEAVLYFNDSVFSQLCLHGIKMSQLSDGHRYEYEFDWLDEKLLSELRSEDSSYSDTPPYGFKQSPLLNGGYVMLSRKILLKLRSQ